MDHLGASSRRPCWSPTPACPRATSTTSPASGVTRRRRRACSCSIGWPISLAALALLAVAADRLLAPPLAPAGRRAVIVPRRSRSLLCATIAWPGRDHAVEPRRQALERARRDRRRPRRRADGRRAAHGPAPASPRRAPRRPDRAVDRGRLRARGHPLDPRQPRHLRRRRPRVCARSSCRRRSCPRRAIRTCTPSTWETTRARRLAARGHRAPAAAARSRGCGRRGCGRCSACTWRCCWATASFVAANDGWNEQIVKRGWTSHGLPSVITPALSAGWLALVVVAVVAYLIAFRVTPRPPRAAGRAT